VRIRAFVFDDNEAIRSMLWHLLDSRGYEVFTFPDPGLCPLHLAVGCRCPEDQACGDIIISDVNMPNITGLEFVENQIKKGCKVKNVALISGAWSESDLEYTQRLGCQPFHKPFTIDEINEWLDECENKINPNRLLSDWFQGRTHQSVSDELA
jgi:CheY-like chemotaxis protein